MYPTDLCWETGNYTDDCCCDFVNIVKNAAVMTTTTISPKI